MAGLGVYAHVGIAKETTFGTPVTASDYLQIVSESISHNIEEVVREAIRGIADEPASLEGLTTITGDIVVEVQPQTIGYLLRSALGAPVSTGAATQYKHVFTPVQSDFATKCALPPYTLEVHRDLDQAFQFSGCAVNSLQFSWGVDQKILRCTASILGKSITLIAKTSPTFEAANPFTWEQATYKTGAPLAAIDTLTAIQITINNNLEAVATLNNTKEISRIRRNGYRTVELQLTYEVEDLTEYNRFKAQSENAFEFDFISEDNKIKFGLPKVRYTSFPLAVSGSGRLTVAVAGKAKYDTATSKAIGIELTNSKVSY